MILLKMTYILSFQSFRCSGLMKAGPTYPIHLYANSRSFNRKFIFNHETLITCATYSLILVNAAD